MQQVYLNPYTQAEFRLTAGHPAFDRNFYGRDRKDKPLTIVWNRGETQQVMIDGIGYLFPPDTILCLMVNESFHLERPDALVAWQFNRDFYCIINHDQEVSCVGFLFYGSAQRMFVRLDERHRHRCDLLLQLFQEEFETADHVQGDMMQALLTRLIIIVTRLAREQYVNAEELPADKLEIIRKYNLLVENNYREQHQVKFYAGQLHKSPKTLSNLFALYNHKSPQQIIHERVALEARRLLGYTDKAAKEIAYELGFEDANHFSRFFKKQTGVSPTDFKRRQA